MKKIQILFLLIFIIALSACSPSSPAAVTESVDTPATATPPSTTPPEASPTAVENTPAPEAESTDIDGYPAPGTGDGFNAYPAPEEADSGYPAPDSSSGSCQPLPAVPQPLQFMTSDGLTLAATFYPPAGCAAPVVLLMHQFGSSKESWADMAVWLQNRGGSAPAWAPEMPEDLSFAVFTFDFRSHGESDPGDEDGIDDEGYLQDAEAALGFVRTLPNVQTDQIITMGASIGADASLDVCLLLDGDDIADFQEDRGCIGAFAFSPGSFLDVPYVEAATRLSQPPFDMQIGCAAAELDGNTADLCGSAIPGRYTSTIYPGRSEHGIALLQPGLDPDIGQIVLNFLLQSINGP